ncbi:hypothetical protein CVT24_003383 [Panaeolus cyanescens]|uniref:Uncharacterized protein n=1 Tax=Panaeolus cyanescens TaxID=181874 RepID=A0A409Y772_9AGAR|nr:hypothetical protein CVT24_003383 [Panaeolus cyanescens]
MPSFDQRPFPPPALEHVPIEYITRQLHDLANDFWDKPETADCTIIVPFPHANGRPEVPGLAAASIIEPTYSYATNFEGVTAGRRATQPPLNAVPRMSLPLHMDYLSAHSSFLRGLFSGAIALDLMFSSTPPKSTNGVPPDRLPRLMPCSPDHPIVLLPVPDPTSLYLLIHWMYFGDFTLIQQCLLNGSIQWEGIARNVEYLGLNADIKIFLGNWYHAWLDPEREPGSVSDSETTYSDDEEEHDDDDDDDCATEVDMDDTVDNNMKADLINEDMVQTPVVQPIPIA